MNKFDTLLHFDKYIIFGATNSSNNVINLLSQLHKEVSFLLDNDNKKVGQILFDKYEVYSPAILKTIFDNKTLIIIGSAYQKEIFEQLMSEFNIPNENIFPYIDNMMYEVYSNLNFPILKIESILNTLEDDFSKKYFKSLLKFRKTLNLLDIEKIELCKEQYIHYMLNYNNLAGDIIDVGAYNGDSLIVFKRHIPHVNKFYCIEPFESNFEELEKNIKALNIHNTIALQYAISDKDDNKVYFEDTTETNSTAQILSIKNSDNFVLTKTIDSLFHDKKIVLIKMDIEGYEMHALEGAKKTIKEQSPNLIISAYHASTHIFDIVEKIMSYNKNYSLYCSHHPLAIHEIEYYFINKSSKC